MGLLKYRAADDNVIIDLDVLNFGGWECYYYYLSHFDEFFDTYTEFESLLKSVSENHPNGVSAEYFALLYTSYPHQKALVGLQEKGMVTEDYDSEGRPVYKLNLTD
jgi:hypothetical protein